MLVEDTPDRHSMQRRALVLDAERALRAGTLRPPHAAAILVVARSSSGVTLEPGSPEELQDAIGNRAASWTNEQCLREAILEPPADHLVLVVLDERGMSVGHVRRGLLAEVAR